MDVPTASEIIYRQLQGECLSYLSDETGASLATLYRWRAEGLPDRPHLSPFQSVCRHYGLPVSLL